MPFVVPQESNLDFFKGSLIPDFRLQVFFHESVLLKYTMGAISNFYENSRIYSKVSLITGVNDTGCMKKCLR